MLDAGCLQFSYSVLAASAIAHIYSQHTALSVSGRSHLPRSCSVLSQVLASDSRSKGCSGHSLKSRSDFVAELLSLVIVPKYKIHMTVISQETFYK